MNVVLVTVYYPPGVRSASHLMRELAEELKRRRHTVHVVTAYPCCDLAAGTVAANLSEFSNEDGISVLRVKTLSNRTVSYAVKGLAQLTMPNLFLRKIKQYLHDRIDVVIVYSPPLTLAKVGAALKAQYGTKFILNIQDIFPQNAIDLGVLKNKWLIRLFKTLERKAYASADEIIVHSKGNRDFLLSENDILPDKVRVVHNWIDIQPYTQAERTGRFRLKYGLEDKFVFLFAGVMGPSQGLDLVIQIAERVKANSNLCFLLVGDGTEKSRLQKMANSLGLRNVIFAPFVSKEEYPYLVKDMDVGLLSLTNKNQTPVVPGKILGYMAAGIPVLAFVQRQSDVHELIRVAKCGYSMVYGEPEKAANLVECMYSQRDSLRRLGHNGAKYVAEFFSLAMAVDRIETLFQDSSANRHTSRQSLQVVGAGNV